MKEIIDNLLVIASLIAVVISMFLFVTTCIGVVLWFMGLFGVGIYDLIKLIVYMIGSIVLFIVENKIIEGEI